MSSHISSSESSAGSFSPATSSFALADLSPAYYYQKKLAKQPVFDFMIQHDDFYINTHGVSITESSKAYTSLSNGLFYVLNKNNQPLVFGSLNVSTIKFRNESAIPANALKISFYATSYNTSNTHRYDTYNVLFRSQVIGVLTLSRKTKYENDLNFVLNPFQSIEFGASYLVKNLNLLDVQYYGASNINPDKKKGTIDITLTIKCYKDVAMTNPVYESITLTVNLVDTGYVPAATTVY